MNAVHGSQNFFPFSSENDAAQLIKRVGGQGALTIQRKEVEPYRQADAGDLRQ